MTLERCGFAGDFEKLREPCRRRDHGLNPMKIERLQSIFDTVPAKEHRSALPESVEEESEPERRRQPHVEEDARSARQPIAEQGWMAGSSFEQHFVAEGDGFGFASGSRRQLNSTRLGGLEHTLRASGLLP